MIRLASVFLAGTIGGVVAAFAHPSALEHTHAHGESAFATPETVVAVGLVLSICAAIAFVRLGKGN